MNINTVTASSAPLSANYTKASPTVMKKAYSQHTKSVEISISDYTRGLVKAANKAASEANKADPQLVELGKQIINSWQPPTNEKVDKIMNSLLWEI